MSKHTTSARVIPAPQHSSMDSERVRVGSRTAAPSRTDFCARRVGCVGPIHGGWYDLDESVS